MNTEEKIEFINTHIGKHWNTLKSCRFYHAEKSYKFGRNEINEIYEEIKKEVEHENRTDRH